MLSDTCFEFSAAIEEGLEYQDVFREVGKLRGDIEHYSDPMWPYVPQVIDELRVATANVLAGTENALVELTHRARTVTWHYDVPPGHPWFELSWEQFKEYADRRCLYSVSRTRQSEEAIRELGIGANGTSVDSRYPSKDVVRAKLNRAAVAQLRRQYAAAAKASIPTEPANVVKLVLAKMPEKLSSRALPILV